MTPTAIWTVATIGLHDDRRIETSTWGYYLTREEAIAGMQRCVDTEVGYYTHAIIERFEPGIYSMCEEKDQVWFEWRDAWVACEKPKGEEHVVNYGMG